MGKFIDENQIRSGINWHIYCRGNPVIFWNPLGLATIYIYSSDQEGTDVENVKSMGSDGDE